MRGFLIGLVGFYTVVGGAFWFSHCGEWGLLNWQYWGSLIVMIIGCDIYRIGGKK